MAYTSITLRSLREREAAQVPPRLGVRIVAVFVALQVLLLAALMLLFPSRAGAAAPVKGDISVTTAGGYARLVFALAEEVEAEVRLANGIVIVTFKQPVDLSVDRIPTQASGYVGAARRDPDGTAVRMALTRKVTVNTMAAGEKLFVDLLPEGWSGLPPGLPQEVIEDLARRAREAEKKARAQQRVSQQRQLPPVRVRVGVQPTFTRYTFGLPALIPVSTERADDKLTMTFEAPLRFDLADVQAMLPSAISSVDSQPGQDVTLVHFEFIGKVDVRTFREDNNYILDVQPIRPRADGEADKPSGIATVTVLAEKRPPPAPAPPVAEQATAPKPAPVAKPVEVAKSPEATKSPEAPKPPDVARPVEAPKPAQVAKPAETAPPSPAKPAAPAAGVVASNGSGVWNVAAAEPVTAPATIPAREGTQSAREGAQSARESAGSDATAPVVVEVRRQGDAVRLTFPFAAPTPAAMFRRGDTIWLVFDSKAPIDVGRIAAQSGRSIRNATVTPSQGGQVVQLKLYQPKLTSAGSDGATWTVIVGDTMLEPTQPLSVVRLMQGGGRNGISIPFQDPRNLHRLTDPEVGDTLLVVTALGPARGFLKPQDFVEFNALVSTHGIAVQPLADDVSAEVGSDKVVVTRPGGLTLSNAGARPASSAQARDGTRRGGQGLFTLDPQTWGFDRESDFRERQNHLITAAAMAGETQRTPAQLELARFYLARDLIAEAKGVLDVAASDERNAQDSTPLVLRAIANIMLGRGADAMRDLTHNAVSKRSDIALWRALALSQQGKWVEAREGFRSLETSSAALPLEMQRLAFQEAARTALEVRDFGAAASLINEFDTPRRSRSTAPLPRCPTLRRPRARGCARSRCASRSERSGARTRRRRWSGSPPAGAVTRPRPRRCSCSGALTRRMDAIATRSS
jgi:outer membrane biosynthesis protein TonB